MEIWMQTAPEKSNIPIAPWEYAKVLHSANYSCYSILHLSGTDG